MFLYFQWYRRLIAFLHITSPHKSHLEIESKKEKALITSSGLFLYQKSSIYSFQVSQTFPTKAGPGFKVNLPGTQPTGVTSVPSLARMC